MKLIMTYTSGNGYEYSCTETVPVEYESEEALICDFMDAAREAHNKPEAYPYFKFLGEEFTVDDFIIPDYDAEEKILRGKRKKGREVAVKPLYVEYPPTIQTLEEWFEQNKISA